MTKPKLTKALLAFVAFAYALLAVYACTPAERAPLAGAAQLGCIMLTRTLEPAAESLCATIDEIYDSAEALAAKYHTAKMAKPPTDADKRAAMFDEIKARRAAKAK